MTENPWIMLTLIASIGMVGLGLTGIVAAREARAEGRLARRLCDWYASGDTGLSSKAIARAALGLQPRETSGRMGDDLFYPVDWFDFGRCRRLIQQVPEAQNGLSRLAVYSAPWRYISQNWEEMVRLYDEGQDGKLYVLLKRARSHEKAD